LNLFAENMSEKERTQILDLESKIQILEVENMVLSSKVEENLLLNKAFSEINSSESIEDVYFNTLESISILLNIPFSGLFELKEDNFQCISSYALFQNNDTNDVVFHLKNNKLLEKVLEKISIIRKNEARLIYNNNKIKFSPECFATFPVKTEFSKNQVFVFAEDDIESIIKDRLSVLEKIVKIISSKLERLFYQRELERLYNKVKKSNDRLVAVNKELKSKNKIIKEQNEELKLTLNHLKEGAIEASPVGKNGFIGDFNCRYCP
jgi:transcriptional regulator with GAF, ATPase, and Fis domain